MNKVQNLLVKIIGTSLFGTKLPRIEKEMMLPLVKESEAQTVYPLLFSAIGSQLQEKLSDEQYNHLSENFFRLAVMGTRNFDEHSELHELMTANGVAYVVLKGLASAMYYPEPSLRTAGDVDFLVSMDKTDEAGMLLESIGFVVDHSEEDYGIHIAYSRPPMSIWELHHTVNGIPDNALGRIIQAEIDETIATARKAEVDGAACLVPDPYHHGLILLLHTASHLTSEGVGLRHLCDWVVFASSLSDPEFRVMFEKKLKSFGLWRFAQVLTLLGIQYLGAPKRVWALEALGSHKGDDVTLKGLMNDILSGGNFGKKDMNRYREIKYISDRGDNTVSSGGVLRQGFKTLNKKVFTDFKTIDKHRALLPFGYIAEGSKYIGLLVTGKRKSSGTKQMLKEAAERKKLYNSIQFFIKQ